MTVESRDDALAWIQRGAPGHEAAARATPAGIPSPELRRVRRGTVLAASLPAGVAGWAALVATVVLVGEIGSEPTSVPGIDSSSWTGITGVTGLFLGADAVHGDFHLGSIVFGAGALLVYALALAVLGVALLAYMQGAGPGAFGAALQGIVYGLFAQVFVVNALVNSLQSSLTVYESIPQWGWWLAHGAYGAMLGVAASRVLRGARGASPP